MELLEQRILRDGRVYPGNVLKIDSFLNHQVDIGLCGALADEFVRLFGRGATKVLTVEASGIVLACLVADRLGVPMLFAKKQKHSNVDGGLYTAEVHSYTTDTVCTIAVCADYLSADDRVLVIDDFLARGQAALGLAELVRQAGATLVGCGFAVEKGFQDGGATLRARGVHVESLAIVDEMREDGFLRFRRQN